MDESCYCGFRVRTKPECEPAHRPEMDASPPGVAAEIPRISKRARTLPRSVKIQQSVGKTPEDPVAP
jgi:hypothetical protein